jgi:hypothetical protein
MKMYVEVDEEIHMFLTSDTAAGEWLAACLFRYTTT